MSPEAGLFLAKGRSLLLQGETMLAAELNDAAGRTAYLAAYHVAQAFLFERNGKAAKTHNGVQTEFQRLTRQDARISPALRTFLSVAYNLKSIADYETGPGAEVSHDRAASALAQAKTFIEVVAELIATAGGRSGPEDAPRS